MRSKLYGTIVALSIALLAGCVAEVPAPVIDKSRQSEHAYAVSERACRAEHADEFCHVVARGDTLYSISRRYGLRVIEIASRNDIKAPYIIRPNDLLVVRNTLEDQVQPERLRSPTKKKREQPVAQSPQAAAEAVKQPPVQPPKPSVEHRVNPLPKMKLHTVRTKPGWQWPVPYEPLASSNATGLDYLLADGTEIVAAIAGKVIYAGAGLNKFRHLIIVDATTSHLVAYEFNTKHTVKEGQNLATGDVITSIAPSNDGIALDANRNRQFRFEIWANGKPLNPNAVIALTTRN